MQIHLVSGFLGSGKTTAIQTACKLLMNEAQIVAVIANDQGVRLVDTGYFKSLSIPNRQVIAGCFCCNYQSLEENIQSLTEENNPTIIFAESVGSCTDIIATVVKPLQQFHNEIEVTISTLADVRLLHMLYIRKKPLFADEVAYIYEKQLEEASVIVVTKTDLSSTEEIRDVQAYLQHTYPGKKSIFMDGTSEESVAEWIRVISKKSSAKSQPSLHINYDTYGAGEAALAWLDEEIELTSPDNNAIREAMKLANRIYQTLSEANLPIGHLKFLIDNNLKLSYTAIMQPADFIHLRRSPRAAMLINARVQTTPGVLRLLVDECIEQTKQEHGCDIIVNSVASFQPGYPTPTHRMAD